MNRKFRTLLHILVIFTLLSPYFSDISSVFAAELFPANAIQQGAPDPIATDWAEEAPSHSQLDSLHMVLPNTAANETVDVQAMDIPLVPDWFSAPQDMGVQTIESGALIVDGPATIQHGETFTYTIVALNDQDITTNVVITSSMPTGFTPSQHVFPAGEIEAGGVITYYASYSADHLTVSGQNTVTLTQDGQAPIVRNTPFEVSPGIPMESIRLDGPVDINNCEPISFTLTVTNSHSLLPTAGVIFTSTMPSGFTPTERVYDLGTLAPGEAVSTTMDYTSTCSSVSGQNVITLIQEGYPDPLIKYGNFVVNPGAITLRKTPAVIEAGVGDVVTWTVTVENTGYGDANNVVITDTLGAGLDWVSGPLTYSIASLAPGASESFEVTARVGSCSSLNNYAEAVWGCDVCQRKTVEASVDLLVNNPELSYTPPVINIDYCSNTGPAFMPIENVGAGVANSVFIGVDLNAFSVTGVSAGAEYSPTLRGFVLTDPILPGGNYTLSYSLAFPDICSSASGSSLTYEPSYRDECGNEFTFPVKSVSWDRTGAEPTLNVNITIPAEIQLGDQVTASVNVDAGNISGGVTVTETVPLDWEIINADGGTIETTGVITYIVWSNVSGNATTVFSPVFQTPSTDEADSCTLCGASATNQAIARAVDCQSCQQSDSDTATTELQCDIGVASGKAVSPSSNETCSTYTYTNTYVFESDFNPAASWADMELVETIANAQQYISDSLNVYVISGTQEIPLTGYASDVAGDLIVTFDDAPLIPVPGSTLVIAYDLETTDASNSACSGASWYDWSYFDTGSTGLGACGADGVLEEGVFVSSQAPDMDVTVSGAPSIVSSCGIYTITLDLQRTSSVPAYDVALDVVTDTYAILNVLGYTGLTPESTDIDSDGYHFYYGDQFTSSTTASVDLKVQLHCASTAAPFEATLNYDNKCGDDFSNDRTCGVGGNLNSPTVLKPNLVLYKFPEVIYAGSDVVTWTLTTLNSGSGTAYSVDLLDSLGTGIDYYDSSISSSQGSVSDFEPTTTTHSATWEDLTILPGEKVTIEFEGEVTGCTGLTNAFTGQVGCLDETCLTGSVLNSRVELPDTTLVNTNDTYSEIPTCETHPITATVRNAGLLSVYSVSITETLPADVSYEAGTSEYVLGTGTTPPETGWLSTSDPDIFGNQVVWSESQITELARLYPSQTVWVRFLIRASCDFDNGNIRIQAAYQDTCDSYTSLASDFTITAVPADIDVQKEGRNVTRGSSWGSLIYGQPNDVIEWRLTVENTSSTPAYNFELTDELPVNVILDNVSPIYDRLDAGDPVWEFTQFDTGSWTAIITTTVSEAGCVIGDSFNTATANWGCDDGCIETDAASARLRTRPLFQTPEFRTEIDPPTLSQCGGDITLTLTNDGPPAYDVVLTDTLPIGYLYQETLSSTTPVDYPPTPGTSSPVWGWDTLPGGDTVIVFRVNSGESGTCAVPADGASQITLEYDDLCVATDPYTSEANVNVDVQVPQLEIGLTPQQQTADVNDVLTWNLSITNTGDGPAPNIVITNTLGTGFTMDSMGIGTYPGGSTTPAINGQEITWTPAITLETGQSWTAIVSAVALGPGSHANTLDVSAGCDAGCQYSLESDVAFVSLFEQFIKLPEVMTHTIGSITPFQIQASLPDESVTYENLVLTDTLPSGLSYVSSNITINYDTDASEGAPGQIITNTPAIDGNTLVWNIGNVGGSVEINGTVNASVDDSLDNHDGVSFTNIADLSYVDNGYDYQYQATSEVRLIEPRLKVDKTVTPTSGLEAGDVLTYTFVVTNTGNYTAYESTILDSMPAGIDFEGIDSCSLATTPNEVGSEVTFGTWDLAPDDSVTCVYTSTVLPSIYLNGSFINEINADWSSLDGSVSGEREYDDTPGIPFDADQDIDDAQFAIGGITFVKDIDRSTATIGETVNYTLTISGPLGTIRSLQIDDDLPAGMSYVPGSVAYDGISVPSSFNDSTLVWDFGDALFSQSPATITFSAQVQNVIGNQAGGSRNNQAELTYRTVDNTLITLNDNAIYTIVEPVITISKQIADRPNPTDADDIVRYEVTVSNPGGANTSTAYNVVIEDLLPAELRLQAGTAVFTEAGGASVPLLITSTTGITVTADSIPVGGSISGVYFGIVQDSTIPDTSIENTAGVDWTSMPGVVTGERTGDYHNTSDTLNDYYTTDDTQFDSSNFVVHKSVVTTSEADTLTGALAIGEIIRYRLEVEIPEGTIPNLRLIDLIANGDLLFIDDSAIMGAFVSDNGQDCGETPPATISSSTLGTTLWTCGDETTLSGITPSVNLPDDAVSASDSTSATSYATDDNDTYSAGTDVFFKFGDVTNADSDTDSEYLVVEFNALLVNTTASNRGDVVANSFAVRMDSTSTNRVTSTDNVNQTIVEPLIPFNGTADNKGASPTSGDAGDTITFDITYTAASNANRSNAYDVVLVDDLSSLPFENLSFVSATPTGCSSPGTIVEEVASGVLTVTVPVVSPGCQIAVRFTADLTASVYPGENDIINTASLTYTSLTGTNGTTGNLTGTDTPGVPGSTTGERTGEGTDPNDYTGSDTASVTVPTVDNTKSYVTSSEAHTLDAAGTSGDPVPVTIGEIIRYRLAILIPEGTATNVVIHDTLPAGLTFLNDDTAMAAFICNGGASCMTSSTLDPDPVVSGNSPTAPASVLPDSAVSDAASGNTDTYVSGTDVYFQLGNITNSDRDGDSEYIIIEFNALLDNSVTGSNDAGETRSNTFEVLVDGSANGSTSAAVVATVREPLIPTMLKQINSAPDPLDAGDLITYTLEFTASAGASNTVAYDVHITDTLDTNLTLEAIDYTDLTEATETNTSSTTQVELSYDQILPGSSVVITITARVNADAPASVEIDNQANLTYSSLPGDYGTTGNTTGSDVSADSGDTNGERDGSASPTLNDYHAASSTVTLEIAGPQIDKFDPYPTQSPIGELVEYMIQITLPEGTVNDLVLTDMIPAGFGLVGYNFDLTGYGGDLDPGTVTRTSPTNLPGTDGEDLILTFPIITTTNNNNPSSNTFVLYITLQVLNVFSNQQGANLLNTAKLEFTDPDDGTITVTDPTAPAAVVVIEPVIPLHKSIIDLPATLDAGTWITYELTLSNTGVSSAYNLLLQDPLPSELELNSASLVITTTASYTNTSSDVSNTITLEFDRVNPGDEITIRYLAQLSDTVQPGENIQNTVAAKWTSLPLSPSGERTGDDGAGPDSSVLNNYYTETSSSFQTDNGSISKSLVETSAAHTTADSVAIGEIITYGLTIELPEGNTPLLTVTDNVPEGLAYLTDTLTTESSTFNGSLPAPSISYTFGSGNDLVLTYSNVVVTQDDVSTNNYFTLSIQAVVLDEVGNVGYGGSPTTLTNISSLQIGAGDPILSNEVDVTVVEPLLEISKHFNPQSIEPNEPVSITLQITNTGTTTAFELVIEDSLPSPTYTNILEGVTPAGFTYSTAPYGGGTTVQYQGASLPAGETRTFTFEVTIGGAVLPGTELVNTASITQYTTLPGDDPWERYEPLVSDNDLLDVVGPDLVLTKDDGRTSAVPGDILVYALDVENVGLGNALDATITDTVPVSTTFYAASSAGGWNCNDGDPEGTVCEISIGDMATGASTSVDFAVLVANPITSSLVSIDNSATVFDNGLHGPDPTPLNNTDDDVDPLQPVSIGDFIWLDLNGNGRQDGGEAGFDGMQVLLTWAGLDGDFGTLVDNQNYNLLTSGGGFYEFTGLPSGNFQITFVKPDGYEFTYANLGSDDADSDADPVTGETTTISLTPGSSTMDWDAGIYQTVTIGDYTWHDANADGIRDGGEAAFGTITVTLHAAGPNGTFGDGDDTSAETTTAGDGIYSFTDQPPGSFYLSFSTPDGYYLTFPDQTAQDNDSDPAQSSGDTAQFALTSGNIDNTWDAGYFLAGSIGDRIWYDANADGVQDGDEPGLGSVAVDLRCGGPNGAFGDADDQTWSTTTASDGSYTFTDLPPGNYRAEVDTGTLPDGMSQTFDRDGTGTANLSDQALAEGQDRTDVDFGYTGTGSLGDLVWIDANGNGTQDTEVGLPAAPITLTWSGTDGVFDNSDDYISTTLSVSGGLYSFTSLPAGTYQLEFDIPDGYVFSPLDQGGDDALDSDANPLDGTTTTITLAGGAADNTWDAGLNPMTASIGDRVWEDLNANGIQDAGEPGLGSVTVELYIAAGGLYSTTVTQADGSYHFSDLPANDYTLTFTAPGGYTFSPAAQGSDTTADSDPNPTNGQTGTISLTSSMNLTEYDAGLYQTASIGDQVWHDLNANGIQDGGELGIENVSVTLFNSVGVEQSNMLTLSDGSYSFTGLVPGVYSLTFTTPAEYFISPLQQGGDTALDSDAHLTGGWTEQITVTSGITDTKWDTGLYQMASVGNLVWIDLNGYGIQDLGENGLEDVSVSLFLSDGTPISTMTTTSSGEYSFTNIVPGEYYITFAPPVSYTLAVQGAGTTDTDSDPNLLSGQTDNFTLTSNQDRTDIDAGAALFDYGDLPAGIPLTLLSQDGARHLLNGLTLGSDVSAEGDGQPSPGAAADDLDDGVTRSPGVNWATGPAGGSIDVNASGSGFLNAWIDWNSDGDFDDAGENILSDQAVVAGNQTLTFSVPVTGFPSSLNARFRIYPTSGNSSPTGMAVGGEVEDYRWEFGPTAVNVSTLTASSAPPYGQIIIALKIAIALLGVSLWLLWKNRMAYVRQNGSQHKKISPDQ